MKSALFDSWGLLQTLYHRINNNFKFFKERCTCILHQNKLFFFLFFHENYLEGPNYVQTYNESSPKKKKTTHQQRKTYEQRQTCDEIRLPRIPVYQTCFVLFASELERSPAFFWSEYHQNHFLKSINTRTQIIIHVIVIFN